MTHHHDVCTYRYDVLQVDSDSDGNDSADGDRRGGGGEAHDYVPDDFYGGGGGGAGARNAASSSSTPATAATGGWRGLLNAGLSMVSRRRGKTSGGADAGAAASDASTHISKRRSQLMDVCLVPTAARPEEKLRNAFGRGGGGGGGGGESAEVLKLRTCGVYTSANLNASSLEMTGYLLRQSRKVATQWAKEWCVLRDGELLFFASREAEQAYQSPSVVLELDAFINFRMQPGFNPRKPTSVFDIVGPQRTYTMMASSGEELESWMSSLLNAQSVRRRSESKSLKFSGALIKLRHGSAKTRWYGTLRTTHYARTRTRTRTHAHAHVHARTHVHVHARMCTRTRTLTHAHTYAHRTPHTHACTHPSPTHLSLYLSHRNFCQLEGSDGRYLAHLLWVFTVPPSVHPPPPPPLGPR